nr:hypothetical protein [Brevundimonas sp.]
MTSYPPEPTPIDDARPPAFHHWNVYPKKWENLGARLLDADPRTKSADLFEIGGVAQYGIDAIGDCATGGGCIVQSAKCYEEATAAKIEDWSDDFLKHWESYWEPRGVRTFILSVAAPNIVSAKNGDQIQREIARFAALGIGAELTSRSGLLAVTARPSTPVQEVGCRKQEASHHREHGFRLVGRKLGRAGDEQNQPQSGEPDQTRSLFFREEEGPERNRRSDPHEQPMHPGGLGPGARDREKAREDRQRQAGNNPGVRKSGSRPDRNVRSWRIGGQRLDRRRIPYLSTG